MHGYTDYDYRSLHTASRLLTAFATIAGALLQNERLEDRSFGRPFEGISSLLASNAEPYIKAFTMLCKALDMEDPFTEARKDEREQIQQQLDRLQREHEAYKDGANKDRKTRIETEEALRQRVKDAFESMHDFVRLLEDTEVSHKQREGQFALLHKHLEALQETTLFPIDDIPF